jgi:hypothetical protein
MLISSRDDCLDECYIEQHDRYFIDLKTFQKSKNIKTRDIHETCGLSGVYFCHCSAVPYAKDICSIVYEHH